MPQVFAMSVSFIGLFVLVGLAGLIFMAVLGLIALLTNPRTRDAAKILLGAGAAVVLLLLLLGGLFVGYARVPRVVQQREMARMEMKALEQAQLQAQLQDQIELPEEPGPVVEPEEPEDAPSDKSASPKEEGEAAASQNPEANPEVAAEDKVPAPKKPDEAEPGELSVPPLAETGPPAPAWVEWKPHKEDSVYYWPVTTTPSADAIEAEEEALPQAFDVAVADYIRTKLKLGARAARQVHLGPDYLEKLVGDDIWVEPLDLSVGEFVRLHALVKFDRDANEEIRQQWEQERLVGRLYSAAGLLCVALLFLAFVYCYLKIDQITHGSQRALLRIAAILVILGLTLAAVGVVSVSVA